MMRIKDYRSIFIEKLQPIYDAVEAESFFYLILEFKMNMKRIDLALQPDSKLPQDQLAEWDSLMEQLLQEVPIQYLLGRTHFYGLEFEVDKNVLIPRPETEELVDWIILDSKIQRSKDFKIIDIGTGSGCIAIALSKNITQAQVAAIDISEKAIDIASKNAVLNDVEVTFIRQNILETADLNAQFDIIVSNPPYVRNLEKAEIKRNVLEHEPHLALFVADNDALLFYRKIAALAKINLKEKGKLYFEINQYLGKETVVLLEDLGFDNITLRKDIYGNDRMISASKPN